MRKTLNPIMAAREVVRERCRKVLFGGGQRVTDEVRCTVVENVGLSVSRSTEIISRRIPNLGVSHRPKLWY